MGTISYVHLSTGEKRTMVAAEYSSKIYGITVFQVPVLSKFLQYIIVNFF